jgi:TetR/AcrR family transcriptional regulator, transcriptional repressor for nem operon
MSKGELSKEHIIAASVPVFNTKGYSGTSLQDIMDSTGFKKGGIYRHFSSKEELAAAAFGYAYNEMKKAYADSYDNQDPADNRLIQFLNRLKTFMTRPPVKGGCPILNSATETDDTNETLRQLVRKAALDWEHLLITIFEDGKRDKIFSQKTEPVKEARFFIASIEGSIMLCKLHRSAEYGLITISILQERVQSLKK